MTDISRLWSSQSAGARAARVALLPAAGAFRAATTLRDIAYRAGVFRVHALGLPAVSVGNLTVGGTGKTPVSSWIANELAQRGAHPAILLRGYGDDEAQVHRVLSPQVPVVADPDRVRAAGYAREQGADVLVLDDAFQHRRARRDVDIVLVSADAAHDARWPLPAGPWREPLAALRRAQFVLVTRKASSTTDAEGVLAQAANAAPGVPTGIAYIASGDLVQWGSGERRAPRAGARALAVSGIGNPLAFEAQLTESGARVSSLRYSDHHRYTADDVTAIRARAEDADMVVCTLKDAVKLGPLWPRGAPTLWYLSQRVTVERGEQSIAGLLATLVAARRIAGPV
jgi:tetraacyldisaccharide 4'-kinase